LSLRHALLGLLADRPRTGYALVKQFEGSLGYAWPALHSQIYPELARLAEAGLIRQSEAGPRGSKTYEVTEDGLAEVRRWLLETEPDRRVRNEALLRVYFLWLLEPEEAARYLEGEAEAARALLAELEAIAECEPAPATRTQRAFRLALEWGLRSLPARIEWAEWAAREVAREATARRRRAG
jgi:DNA-binding PadR family transcriptional regulator